MGFTIVNYAIAASAIYVHKPIQPFFLLKILLRKITRFFSDRCETGIAFITSGLGLLGILQ